MKYYWNYFFIISMIIASGCINNESLNEKDNIAEEALDKPKSLADSIDPENKGTKKTYICHLPKDHPAHFDPFYNGHLHENFDPKQVDFSSKFYELRNDFFSSRSKIFDSIANYDFSKIWLRNHSQEGVIGKNYRRITIKILSSTRSKENPLKYLIEGESKVGNNRCDFKGEIQLTNAYYFAEPDVENTIQGIVYGKYNFLEDSTQNHVGAFNGIIESSFLINRLINEVSLDTLSEVADGYNNNNFVGIWKEYNSNEPKKCIWGEYRLPFTFDFDIGDGEMYVNEKYRKNGWE